MIALVKIHCFTFRLFLFEKMWIIHASIEIQLMLYWKSVLKRLISHQYILST